MATNLLESTEEIFMSVFERLGVAWWLKILTNNPRCLYYFGPFITTTQAKVYQPGYIEDLEEENAQILRIEIVQQDTPKELTVYQEDFPEEIYINVAPIISNIP